MAEDQAAPDGGEGPTELRSRLEAARAEIARLELEAANASARAGRAEGDAAALRASLDEAEARIEASGTEAEALRMQIGAAADRERGVADRYRELVLRVEHTLPAELIAGDTIEAIDASVVAARDVVGRVRSHIEAQATAVRVPAGAPQRAAPDLSDMTPQQKIRYGLEQRANS
jgi:hypothetical protein